MTTESFERESSPTPPPRIVRISVTKLFGVLNHDVELKRAQRVTILHGINGVGKTKLLELTAALTRGQVWRLMDVPFEKLRVEFDDGTATEAIRSTVESPTPSLARKRRTRRPRRELAKIDVRRTRIGSSTVISRWSEEASFEETQKQRRSGLPSWIRSLGDGTWLDTHAERVVTANELVRLYGIPGIVDIERPTISAEKLAELIPCAPIHLIETQRLLRVGGRRIQPSPVEDDDPSLVMTVHELASELKKNIAGVQHEFFRKTQTLDRTLTQRVLRANIEVALGESLRARLEALDKHRERLERVGLLDAGALGPTLPPAAAAALNGDRAIMISVHTDDAEQKFAVLDALATRLELLLDSMNEKLAYPKKLVLDHDRELSVQRHDETISLDQLSSGEQHELVLLYDLAFRVRPSTLVLIDEPELSLHPIWQQQFLDDILKIAKNGAFDVLLATHSPYITGDRNDLCVELKAEKRV